MALPKTFKEGEVLTAGDLNAQLQYLDQRSEGLRQTVTKDTGWVSPPVWGNGYIGYAGGGHLGLQYRVRDGIVQLAGAVVKQNNGPMDDKAIASLPAGVRPRTVMEGAGFFVKPDGNIFTTYRGSGAINGNVMWMV